MAFSRRGEHGTHHSRISVLGEPGTEAPATVATSLLRVARMKLLVRIETVRLVRWYIGQILSAQKKNERRRTEGK